MPGYDELASLMAQHNELAVVRRFSQLNILDLLYRQAEIFHKHEELQTIAALDRQNSAKADYDCDWWSLSQRTGNEDDAKLRWKKILEIRECLEKYNDALLKQIAISRLGGPRRYDLGVLRGWLERPSMGSYPLAGADRLAWNEEFEHDLVAIRPRVVYDPFSGWFSERFLPIYHSLIGKELHVSRISNQNPNLHHYDDNIIANIIRVATTVTASILPMCSVIVLYIVQSENLRLGIIVIFSAIFALALSLMTNARTIEVFASTAAFAAVNVVFLTNS